MLLAPSGGLRPLLAIGCAHQHPVLLGTREQAFYLRLKFVFLGLPSGVQVPQAGAQTPAPYPVQMFRSLTAMFLAPSRWPSRSLTMLWSCGSQILTVPSVKPMKVKLSSGWEARAWQVRPAQDSSSLTCREGTIRSYTPKPSKLWPPISRVMLFEDSR